MKDLAFILKDPTQNELIAVVLSPTNENKSFWKKVKQAVAEHYCLESVEIANFVDANKKSIFIEGIEDEERVSHIVSIEHGVVY